MVKACSKYDVLQRLLRDQYRKSKIKKGGQPSLKDSEIQIKVLKTFLGRFTFEGEPM